MLNYEELTIQELRRLAKEKGIEPDRKDTKAILIEKIKEANTKDVKRVTGLINVRKKMNETRKVIVTKLNPEDTVRDSVIISITNATGSYQCAVPFNVKVDLPLPIIKNLEKATFQGWTKVTDSRLGTIDKPITQKAYNVQYVN